MSARPRLLTARGTGSPRPADVSHTSDRAGRTQRRRRARPASQGEGEGRDRGRGRDENSPPPRSPSGRPRKAGAGYPDRDEQRHLRERQHHQYDDVLATSGAPGTSGAAPPPPAWAPTFDSFTFQERRGRVNLRAIDRVDTAAVTVDGLLELTNNLCFARFGVEDLQNFTDKQIVKLVHLSQYTVE